MDKLAQLRKLLGINDDQPKATAGAVTGGKTPQQLYEEEMAFLQKQGADYGGKDGLRRAFRRLGRFGR